MISALILSMCLGQCGPYGCPLRAESAPVVLVEVEAGGGAHAAAAAATVRHARHARFERIRAVVRIRRR